MISLRFQLILLWLFIQAKCIDLCRENESYKSCIESDNEKCKWDNIRSLCEKTFDYQIGCSLSLNKKGCVKQLGNVLGEQAKCRFKTVCEVIPNFETEQCQNSLSKFGCISIQNREQVCYWKDGSCYLLQQNQWDQIQQDFGLQLYSASACSFIEHYLIIHNTILWDIIQYSPNLFKEAENQFKKEMGQDSDDNINYDDPNSVFLQNNYVNVNGQFAWFTYRESKSITRTNLQISYRQREGCIAIEIENDSDFLNIISVIDEKRGFNHVYCKYLNRNPTITDQYVFSDGVCKKFIKSDLNKEQKIIQFDLSCKQIDFYQCIYFDSQVKICKLIGLEYEYPCMKQEEGYVSDCENTYCTVRQCQQLQYHYMDTDTNRCSNICSQAILNTQDTCEAERECIYLGTTYIDLVKTCSPKFGCDQIGIDKIYCKTLYDQCGWDEELQRCYRINDENLKFIKCNQAFSAKSCILITLSDQLCFWDGFECKNILEQPILISQRSLIDYETPDSYEFFFRKASNLNFCRYHLTIPTEYKLDEGKCYFGKSTSPNDLTLINRYSCIYVQSGFKKWDFKNQRCISLLEKDVVEFSCNEQVFVNEKVCQQSKVSNSNLICIFDQINNSCKELDIMDTESFGCEGYGFSKVLCLSKQKPGLYCQFIGGLCRSINENYINSILCSTLQNVNSQVCKVYQSESTVCLYDKSINSCYTPSIFTQINYISEINRYGCQKVQDSFTYFDLNTNQCIQFNENDIILLKILDCTSNFVNQKTCQAIIKKDQNCYWDVINNKCQNYSQYSTNCSDYQNFTSRICQALVSDTSKQFIKENYCTFNDNKCQSNSAILIDCGESEQMNIHRCSGLTGLNQAGEYIQMCAFINYQCTALIDDSMDAYLILNIIQCSQANLKACTKIQTKGNYCQRIDYVSNNNFIIDKKCIQVDDTSQSCVTININFKKNEINPNHCSRANDSCLYDESNGCSVPIRTDLDCDTIGLSYFGCIRNTQNHRCVFNNQKCQYLASHQSISNCKYLNKFACSNFQYLQCYWNDNICTTSGNYTTQYGSDYTCSLITSNQFFVSNGITCIQEQQSNFGLYNCDSPINQFACGSINNQYCQFFQNQCQFYNPILCEDSVTLCSENITSNSKCVLKNGQCFHYPCTDYDCDFFEKSNYEFCRQYPNCVYDSQKCQTIYQSQNLYYCFYLPKIKCIIQNQKYACTWRNNNCEDFYQNSCPSLKGFHSYNACIQFENCIFGYTKSGLGFCYQDKDFDSLSCEQLNKSLCLDDLSHLNFSLQCYWDESCKNIQNTSITDCESLQNFQSSYSACIQMDQEECKYSFIDKKCKLIQEYVNQTVCQGTTLKQCSQIRNTCYFNGSNCLTKGQVEQLNKFGCINQVGQWKFVYFKCHKLSNEIQQNCINLSKEACLSDLTKELSCKWSNNKCLNVLKNENKVMTSCQNLNQRACENVHLSNIRCIWNKEMMSCEESDQIDLDCNLENIGISTSISICSSSITKSCVRHYDKTKCTQINMKVIGCTGFGLNMKGCIEQTNIPCQWIQVGEGGYCDDANIYLVKCIDMLNQSACETIQTQGQICQWEQSIQKCSDAFITSCESATLLHSFNACKAIIQEPCQFDPIKLQCNKLSFPPSSCSNYYNYLACQISTDNCIWLNNKCIYCDYHTCFQYNTKIKCMNSNDVSCQWLDNKCVNFIPLIPKIDCISLPSNINKVACQLSSFDPCIYDSQLMQCVSDQENYHDLFSWRTLMNLISDQDSDIQSSLLQGTCEKLHNEINCRKSRIPNKSCIWKGSCKEVTDYSDLFCSDPLNIWGCLNVTKEDQQCMWLDFICQYWDQSYNIMENVNKNVCIHNSINSVYEYHSCVEKQIDTIQCQQDGVSKITCLSIPNRQCQWITSCTDFILSNQQKCSDYQNVTIYVCQMVPNLACGYDLEKKSCISISNDLVVQGVSLYACINNIIFPTFWNGQKCQELLDNIECDTPLIVNELACILKVKNTACMYDQIKNECTSRFNIWSLQCNSKGLNLLGCIKVEQEPCIFKENKCQVFTDVFEICMFVSLVNSKACASVLNQNCTYDSINFKCQTPLINENQCNVEGINKNVCNQNALCLWNNDNLNCKCKQDQEIERCQLISISECKQNNQCHFDINIQKCVKRQCYHLKEDECNSILDHKTCYLSLNNGCQPAIKCEDIIDPKNPCQTIYINSQPCYQVRDTCVTINNYSLSCPYSDCSNSNCIFYYGVCKLKTCDDYSASECQLNNGCYLDLENNCQQLLRCSQITSEIYGEQVTNICNLSTVNGLKCNWQKFALLDDTEICTNQFCEMYGSSNTLCQGNEINGYSCILLNELICKQCESITESCLCNSQINTCFYQNGKCNSILCSSFLTRETCLQAQDRCYWSINSQDNIELCVKQCEKIIDQDECNSRINECYFENQNGLCVKGQKQIPNLSSNIIIEEFYAVIIQQSIYLIFIIFI